MTPGGGRELWRGRPSWRTVVADSWVAIVLAGAVVWFGRSLMREHEIRSAFADWAILAVVAGAGLVVVRSIVRVLTTSYTLTDRTARAEAGLLTRRSVELRVEDVQRLAHVRTPTMRALGLGNVLIGPAGVESFPIVWWGLGRSGEVLQRVRETARVRGEWSPAVHAHAPSRSAVVLERSAPGIAVVGIAGGVGSGKSAVARMLGELGCVVVDSDARAKAALERPDVREQLRAWWGAGVFRADGTVDRAKIADIVFAAPAERARLEGLIHPLVRAERGELIREAAAGGAKAVIVDAPLLFEAGVDRECDAVIFVDAPREVREERVRSTRGWSPEELNRREAAQWPLDRKRAASTVVVVNDGDEATLRGRVGEALDRVLAQLSTRARAGRGP